MSNLARSYRALLRASFETALEYRAQVIIWLLSGIFPLVMLAVWLAVVREAGPVTGWGASDFTSYYVAAAFIYNTVNVWLVWDWDDEIRKGDLSVKLLKPLDPVHQLVLRTLGWKLISIGIMAPLIALAAWLIPTIHYPLNPALLGAFLLSLAAGFLLSVVMASAFGMIAFWSTQSGNLFGFFFGIGQFLSGWIAPLALFPPAIRLLASWLPFRSTLGLPAEILMGRLSWPEIWTGLGITLGWIILFFIVYRILWRLGLRRYEAVGA